MNFNGNLDNPKANIEERLYPLFDAMIEGKVIESITCMKGTMNKDKRHLDFELKNFKADSYWQGLGIKDNKEIDYVQGEPRDFYMNWVINFIL